MAKTKNRALLTLVAMHTGNWSGLPMPRTNMRHTVKKVKKGYFGLGIHEFESHKYFPFVQYFAEVMQYTDFQQD